MLTLMAVVVLTRSSTVLNHAHLLNPSIFFQLYNFVLYTCFLVKGKTKQTNKGLAADLAVSMICTELQYY